MNDINEYLRLIELIKSTTNPEHLRAALSLAENLIGNYRMDIDAGIADGIIPPGYCQGSIYRDSVRLLIKALEDGKV